MLNFPNDLISEYKSVCLKLQRFQSNVFKRFALLSVSEISNEFQSLAAKFENAHMSEYAGNCYLGAAKCEELIGISNTEIDCLLKGGRLFIRANDELVQQDGARRCMNQAITNLPERSAVMKAAIIRELKTIESNTKQTSNFSSNSHRIFDLEAAATFDILKSEYTTALEKLTEIFDILTEHKGQSMYEDVILRTTVNVLLLLLILELPATRCHSPSYIKLLERYSSIEFRADGCIPDNLFILLQSLTMACFDKDICAIKQSFDALSSCCYLDKVHKSLLLVVYNKNIESIL